MKASQIVVQIVIWTLSWSLFLFISPLLVLFRCWNALTGADSRDLVITDGDREVEDASWAPKWGTNRYLQLKDINIHYVEAGDKKNQLMLCLHGFPEYWFSWRHQLAEFASTHWVVAVDMRGYGQSEKPSGRGSYHMDVLVEDVREIITALGKDKCILLGHDWGGAIGWNFVNQYPDMVSQFIPMNCPHPAAFYDTIKQEYSQMLKSWYILFFQLPVVPEMIMLSAFRVLYNRRVKNEAMTAGEARAYINTYEQSSDMTAPINYYRNLAFLDLPSRSLVKVPTLLIWGEKDAYLNKSMAFLSQKFVENFILCTIPSATHWVQQDQPQVVNQKIREFIGKPDASPKARKVSLPQLLATKAYASSVSNITF